jgi:DNA-directed RNA polymerase subunit E'/Rpb7
VKLAKVISRYFYQAQAMNINGLGSFKSSGYSDENNSSQNIEFTPNKLVENDTELIQFIIDETGKMRPLAVSDLESFVTSGQQLLNIGKPFFIEGLGAVQKNKQGQIEFVAGEMVSEKASVDAVEERKLRGELREKPQQKIIERIQEGDTTVKPGINWLRILLSIGVLAALLTGGYFIYKYIISPPKVSTEDVKPAIKTDLNLQKDTIKIDSSTLAPVSTKPTLVVGADGKIAYNVVFKTVATKAEADAIVATGNTYKDIKFQAAPGVGTSYKIFVPQNTLATDTAAVKKSIMVYMGLDSTKVYIDK